MSRGVSCGVSRDDASDFGADWARGLLLNACCLVLALTVGFGRCIIAMERGIRISRIWSDDDMVEFMIEVADGTSRFANRVYVGFGHLMDTIEKLDTFKTHVHGGVLDLRFGEFGGEYANGAFHARFHFPERGRLFITCQQESEFVKFGKRTVASSATLYLSSEPALLDRFIEELKRLATDAQGEAYLEAV